MMVPSRPLLQPHLTALIESRRLFGYPVRQRKGPAAWDSLASAVDLGRAKKSWPSRRYGVILDVEATPAHRTAEVDSTWTMVERPEAQFDLTPERLIGDTTYGTAPMLAWMIEEKDIEPHGRCGTKPSANTTASPAMTFTGIRRPMNTVGQLANRYAVNGALSPSQDRGCPHPMLEGANAPPKEKSGSLPAQFSGGAKFGEYPKPLGIKKSSHR